MALTKVSGGILDPGINVAGIVTATGFDGPFIGGGDGVNAGVVTCTGLDVNGNGDISGNLVIGGNLTANGDFTTLNTTLREVEILRVDAHTTAIAGIITQRGTGDIFSAYDTSNEVFKIADGGVTQIIKGTSGGATANTDAALIVDNSSHTYVQFRTPDTKEQGLLFGDDADNDAGAITYSHSSNHLGFKVNANERLRIDSDGRLLQNGMTAIGDFMHQMEGAGGTGKVPAILFKNGTASTNEIIGGFTAYNTSNEVATIYAKEESANDDAYLQFSTKATGGSLTERLRIDSDGRATFTGINEQDIIHITTGNSAGNTYSNIRGDNEAGIRIRGGGSFDGGTIELAGGLRDTDPGIIKFSSGTGSSVDERLRIDSDGRLIIGHTASHPVQTHGFKVQVSGTNYQTSGIAQQRFQDGVSGASLVLAHSRNGTQGNHTILQVNDEYGKIRFFGSDGNDFEGYGASIVAKVENGIANNSTPGRLEFHTTNSGTSAATERLRITHTGNIGVGGSTGTDFSLLDGMVINTDNGDAGLIVNSSSQGHNAYISFSYGSGSSTSHDDQFSAYIGRVGNDNLIFGTRNNLRWKIDSSGHLVPHTAGAVNVGSATTEIGDVYIADDKRIYLGSDQNLSLRHDSSTGINKLVSNPGTMFYMSATNYFTDAALSKIQAQFIHNSYCELRHAGDLRIRTSETGIDVTGEVKASQDYPNFRPVLDFNFAAEKKLDPRITYQRIGPASFTNEFGKVVLIGDNVPRFDYDPSTRESKGLLIEESRVNRNKVTTFRRSTSGRFSMNSADEQIAGENTNGVVSPVGTAKGVARAFFTGQEADPTGSVYAMASTSSSNGVNYANTNTHTSSVWIRTGLETVFKIDAHSNYASASAGGSATTITFIFTLTGDGTVTSIESGGISATVTRYPNNWYRCAITYHRNSTSSVDSGYGVIVYPYTHASYNTNSVTGDIFWLWGPQVEEGAFPTSFIPNANDGTMSTRGADSVKVEGEEFAEFYNNATEHTTIMVGKRLGNQGGADGRLYSISDGTNNNRIDWDLNDGTNIRFSASSGGSTVTNQEISSWSGIDDEFKIAAGMALNNQIGVVNGTAIAAADTSCAMPAGVDRLYFGLRGNEGNQGSLTIKRFMFYPKRLPDSQLVTLTS